MTLLFVRGSSENSQLVWEKTLCGLIFQYSLLKLETRCNRIMTVFCPWR